MGSGNGKEKEVKKLNGERKETGKNMESLIKKKTHMKGENQMWRENSNF